MYLVSTRTMVQAVGGNISPITLLKWLNARHIRPLKMGLGRGNQSLWADTQVAAVALARTLVERGISPEACDKFATFVGTLDPEFVDAQVAAGRGYVLVHGTEILHRLVPREALTEQVETILAGMAQVSPPVAMINFGLALQQTRAALARAEKYSARRALYPEPQEESQEEMSAA